MIRLSTNPHIEAGQGNPAGRKGAQGQAKESEKLPIPLLEFLQILQADKPWMYTEGLVVKFLVGGPM